MGIGYFIPCQFQSNRVKLKATLLESQQKRLLPYRGQLHFTLVELSVQVNS